MLQWKRILVLVGLVNAAVIATIVAFAVPFYIKLLLGIWLAASTIFLVIGERRRGKAEGDLQTIRTLSHHRHDWMNELQVLYGYIRLKKYEKLQDYVDKIKATAMQESLISKLGDPALIAYLFGFRTERRNMTLEIDIEQEIVFSELALHSGKAARFIRESIDLFDRHALASDGEPNLLSLCFDLEEEQLLLDYVYQGVYDERGMRAALLAKLKAFAPDAAEGESEFAEDRVAITVRLPFRKGVPAST